MPLKLTPEQQQQLSQLGINLTSENISQTPHNISEDNKTDHNLSPNIGENTNSSVLSTKTSTLPNLIPLLSLSGLSLISFGGLIFLKTKTTSISPSVLSPQSQVNPTPTQVPKSIQHYLLTSQQYFTQAVSAQSSSVCQTSNSACTSIDLINQSLLAATNAIKEFPDDYRGYEQRGRIYQSLAGSQPQLLTSALTDFSAALKLNPTSADLTRSLASLYAQKGDAQSTLNYLNQTISLEPTKAQNFYDLAKIEQQTGLLSEALNTYNRLLSLITDPDQKLSVESEKSALENLLSQNPQSSAALSSPTIAPDPLSRPSLTDTPLLQADSGSGLIIAAPSTSSNITVNNLSASNSLSGNDLIPAGKTQVTLKNELLSSTSQVYVTAISGGKNATLQLLSKSKDNFTIGIDTPISEDIHFKWWIIN